MPAGCKNSFFLYIKIDIAWVAQWIEQWFPKPLVAGSIPAPGTKFKYKTAPKCHKVSHFGAFLCFGLLFIPSF